MRRPIKYQLLKLTIPAAGSFPINAEADKAYKQITGIHYSCTDINALKDSVFSKFEIDNNEIFPEGFEAKMILTGQEVPPDDRFYRINERAEGSTIIIVFKDAGNAGTYPYNAYIYLRLENPINNDNRA
ncbi:MAG: hypothetical protein WAQ28_13620 [Bacteroidia bacterium]